MSLTPELRSILDTIIEKQEGGWVLYGSNTDDDPDGGWTYAGVTAKLWEKYYKKFVSKEDFKYFLNNNKAKPAIELVYEEEFIIPLQLSKFSTLLQGPLLSCAINRGMSNAVKALQLALNFHVQTANILKIDGQLGPKTLERATVKLASISDIVFYRDKFLYHWTLQYINLVQENAEAWRDYAKFINGDSRKIKSEPSVLRATYLEGWYQRVEFWR